MTRKRIEELILGQNALIASPEMNVRDAVHWMIREHRPAVLIERDHHLIGIFTENDALSRVLAEGRDPVRTKLHEVMTRNPVALTPDRTLLDAFNTMRQFDFRHVAIISSEEEKKPIGVLSLRDFLDVDITRLAAYLEGD